MTLQTIFQVFDPLTDVPRQQWESGIAGQRAGRRDHAVAGALAMLVSG